MRHRVAHAGHLILALVTTLLTPALASAAGPLDDLPPRRALSRGPTAA